jgi:protein kinase C substrate 80K-H
MRILFALLPLFALGEAGAVSLRGVLPQFLDKYQGETFTCFDGSKTIPASRINDEFCDCADGSDEPGEFPIFLPSAAASIYLPSYLPYPLDPSPRLKQYLLVFPLPFFSPAGSSACPLGRFYCRNAGHAPRILGASFVDDGVCDCCDGSDEKSGACPNTCYELGRTAREELFRQSEHELKGAAVRRQREASYLRLRDQWTVQLQEAGGQLAALEAEVAAAQEHKERVEKEDEERRRLAEEHNKAPAEGDAANAAAAATGEAEGAAEGGETLDLKIFFLIYFACYFC